MPCQVSVLNLITSGHVTRSQTSGFFNKQKRSSVVYNLQFLMPNLFNSSTKMYQIYFAKVHFPFFRVCTRKSGIYPEIRRNSKISGNPVFLTENHGKCFPSLILCI